MAADDDFMRILYVIGRIGLGICTMIGIICIIFGLIDYSSNRYVNDSGFVVWSVVALILAIVGFFAAFKEHLFSTLVFTIGQLCLILGGVAFTYMQFYTRFAQGVAIGFGVFYTIMLYMSGHRDLHPLPIQV